MADMTWFTDLKKNGKRVEFEIPLDVNNGNVCLPTGVGKTGVMCDHAYELINANPGKKYIFNISAPTLNLSSQNINNFKAVLDAENIAYQIYVNSSDNADNYFVTGKEDVKKFRDDFAKLLYSKNVIIVASCFKSMHYFIDKLNEMSSKFEIVNYIDESHKLSIYEGESSSECSQVNLKDLVDGSTYTFGFSATPKADVVTAIRAGKNSEATHKKFTKTQKGYCSYCSAHDAIKKNLILAPKIYVVYTDSTGYTPEILNTIAETAQKSNKKIIHKILVSCKSTDPMIALKNNMDQNKYNMFSTCSKHGFDSSTGAELTQDDIDSLVDKDILTENQLKTITDFTSSIDASERESFVFHIRQLIQGIDIRSLSDCVMFLDGEHKSNDYDTMIQTIGRVLRLSTEDKRGKKPTHKTFGGVYFVVNRNSNVQTLLHKVYRLLGGYYSFDDLKFTEINLGFGSGVNVDIINTEHVEDIKYPKHDDISAAALMIDANKDILNNYIENVRWDYDHNIEINFKDEAKHICDMYCNTEVDSLEFINNDNLINKVADLIKRRVIEYKLF